MAISEVKRATRFGGSAGVGNGGNGRFGGGRPSSAGLAETTFFVGRQPKPPPRPSSSSEGTCGGSVDADLREPTPLARAAADRSVAME